jgi:hypothetical protein
MELYAARKGCPAPVSSMARAIRAYGPVPGGDHTNSQSVQAGEASRIGAGRQVAPRSSLTSTRTIRPVPDHDRPRRTWVRPAPVCRCGAVGIQPCVAEGAAHEEWRAQVDALVDALVESGMAEDIARKQAKVPTPTKPKVQRRGVFLVMRSGAHERWRACVLARARSASARGVSVLPSRGSEGKVACSGRG